jgi:ATP-dependent Clp protease ATP-binding subunit ClpC
MFQRFTDEARRSIVLAQEAARGLNHDHIGTAHILLGLTAESQGLASLALERVGVSEDVAVERTAEILGRGHGPPPAHVPFTPGAKRCLEDALKESLAREDKHIGTEHILLALLATDDGDDGDDGATRVLTSLGADVGAVRAELARLMA